MKTTTAPAIVQIDADELKAYSPVNETLATHFTFPEPSIKTKNFGVLDMWKCRKQMRTHGIVIR